VSNRTVRPGDHIQDLDTPAVLVDLDRLEKNIQQWQSVVAGRGIKLRPHIKTHKIPQIALMQIAAGAQGIVSAKVSEAEPFADAGIKDICIAYPVFGERKWNRAAELAAKCRLTVNCDSEEGAKGLSQAASNAGSTIHLQIDIDTGLHRGGIAMNEFESVARLAQKIQALPGVKLDGITTFRGVGFSGAGRLDDAGHEEGRIMVDIADKLRGKGIEIQEVSAGSTPTGRSVAEIKGITEVRAGTYVFYDVMQLYYPSAAQEELALSVLCTVVSHQTSDRLTIDGGSKTFSGDAPKAGSGVPLARALDRKITIERFTEEHGMGICEEPVTLGEKIRVVPYHVCPCVNLNDELVGYRGDRVEVVWPVRARGLKA
jgi:D-serine deaminase-like pyridoxal phosphate-dependent protein